MSGNDTLPFVTPLTQNEYTVTDSFYFAEEVCKQGSNLYMASLVVNSLLTNIPLDTTIDVRVNSFYNNIESNFKIPKDIFYNFF